MHVFFRFLVKPVHRSSEKLFYQKKSAVLENVKNVSCLHIPRLRSTAAGMARSPPARLGPSIYPYVHTRDVDGALVRHSAAAVVKEEMQKG